MKELKFLVVVLLLSMGSSISVQANPNATSSPKSSGYRRPQKSPSRLGIKTPPPSSQQLVNRCGSVSNNKVWLKRRGSNTAPQEYGFLEIKGDYLYYCVGEYERAELLTKLAGIYFDPTALPLPVPTPTPQPPNVCWPATRSVSAKIDFNPIPFDPLQNQGRDFPETVLLNIDFKADGKIGNIAVLSRPHPLLVESALLSAQKIIFTPAKENGKEVCVTQQYSFEFPKRIAIPRQRIALISPRQDEPFRNKPRNVRFVWNSVPNVNTYILEVEYKLNSATSADWHPLPKISEINTNHEMIFPGAVPGRWRVTAELLNGTRAVSEWRDFRFER